jgi:mRNA interferase HicA
MYDIISVNGTEFMRWVTKLGRKQNVATRFIPRYGKGSHGTLFFGDRHAVVVQRSRDIPRGLFRSMCRQLTIDSDDL